jgi:hypothetical protein
MDTLVIGFKANVAIEQVVDALEIAISLKFQLHESSFFGLYYRAPEGIYKGETFNLRINQPGTETAKPAPDHEDVYILLTIMNTERLEILKEKVMKLRQFLPIVLNEISDKG